MVSERGLATLMAFSISIFFAIHPVSVPVPQPMPPLLINRITAPILAIALLWAAQCLDLAVIRNGIVGTEAISPYNIVVLFLSQAYLATTLEITGLLQAIVFWVSNQANYEGWKLYLYFYVMFTLLSILLGKESTVFFGTVWLAHFTRVVDLDPTAWIMAEFAAVNSASMVLFAGNPTNVVISEGFSVNTAAFTAYTVFPFIASSFFCFVALIIQYRKRIPRNVSRVAHRDPQSALLDPLGAWLGGFMLGATLILCLVAGFFRTNVWMISLLFAVGKWMFDIGWDHYRYSRGIPMLGRGLPKDRVGLREGPPVDRDVGDTPAHFPSTDEERARSSLRITIQTLSEPSATLLRMQPQSIPANEGSIDLLCTVRRLRSTVDHLYDRLDRHFPTSTNAMTRLPFTLVPVIFSHSILMEALDHHGWIDLFAGWLVQASGNQLHPTIWLIGIIGVMLCSLLGTDVGTTILLTKVLRAAALPRDAHHGAAIALAIASNVGAIGFTVSASTSGLLWRALLEEEGIHICPRDFALWSLFPLSMMIVAGLGIASTEMTILFRS